MRSTLLDNLVITQSRGMVLSDVLAEELYTQSAAVGSYYYYFPQIVTGSSGFGSGWRDILSVDMPQPVSGGYDVYVVASCSSGANIRLSWYDDVDVNGSPSGIINHSYGGNYNDDSDTNQAGFIEQIVSATRIIINIPENIVRIDNLSICLQFLGKTL